MGCLIELQDLEIEFAEMGREKARDVSVILDLHQGHNPFRVIWVIHNCRNYIDLLS